MENIRMISCAKDGAGDLRVNYGWALQRKMDDGTWVTVAWFSSRQDVKDMVKLFCS